MRLAGKEIEPDKQRNISLARKEIGKKSDVLLCHSISFHSNPWLLTNDGAGTSQGFIIKVVPTTPWGCRLCRQLAIGVDCG
jgi:hypothetical protein